MAKKGIAARVIGMDLETALVDIRLELAQKRLHRPWAKVEIVLGLLVAGLGLLLSIQAIATPGGDYLIYGRQNLPEWRKGVVPTQSPDGYAVPLERRDVSWLRAAAGLALFVLGGYLTLAGHRSHLYLSGNELTAYLAELIRSTGVRPIE